MAEGVNDFSFTNVGLVNFIFVRNRIMAAGKGSLITCVNRFERIPLPSYASPISARP